MSVILAYESVMFKSPRVGHQPRLACAAEVIRLMSPVGTKRTCRAYLTMSVDRDRPEVVGRTSNRRD
jgi:hypothetical protein